MWPAVLLLGLCVSATTPPTTYVVTPTEFAMVPNGTMIEKFVPIMERTYELVNDPDKYNMYIPPKPAEGPILVRVGVNIQSIDEIDERNRELRLNLFLRIAWIDERLKFDAEEDTMYVAMSHYYADKIWKPDIYFPNGRSGRIHDLTIDNTNLRLYASGQIMVVYRYSLAFSCDMDFRQFPFDTQVCSVILESIKYPVNFVKLSWMFSERDMEPELIKLSKYHMVNFHMTEKCHTDYPIGTFSCLRLQYTFKREIFYHLVETFLPSVIIVMASWVSPWLDPSQTPARTVLGVTAMLTIFSQANHVKSSLPPFSYLKAIDVWMLICQFTVFLALIEFMTANYMSRTSKGNAQRLDQCARVAFPACFFLFCILYILFYVVSEPDSQPS
uniref:Uncharacterized protein n=1 Tax=Plectus sambesii TaxID=2011161 RepID=A0A914XP29_9BILA